MENNGYSDIWDLMVNYNVSKEMLFNELMTWLSEDTLSQFADDFRNLYFT